MNHTINLDAIEARAKAATPDAVTYSYEGLTRRENPRHQFSICNGTWQDEPTRPHRCIAMVYSDSEDDAPDAEFYVNARADVLALLADARAHRTRADAAEAECERLREAMRRQAAAVRMHHSAREQMDAHDQATLRSLAGEDRAHLIEETAAARRERDDWNARATALEADRDAARAEVAALRAQLAEAQAIIAGRTVAPTDAEIAAHAAAGGSWLVIFGRFVDAYADADFIHIVRDNSTGSHWWPLDATGRPCAWPTGGA